MSKIKLNLTTNYSTKQIEYNNTTIEVKTYLPIEDKLNIIELVLQECMENGFVNQVKVDAMVGVLMCAKYTNIDFEEYFEDIYNLYDIVKTTDLIDLVLSVCEKDYIELVSLLEIMIDKYEDYLQSFNGVATTFIDNIPKKISEIANELEDFNPEKLEELFNVIKEVGGNGTAVLDLVAKQGQ